MSVNHKVQLVYGVLMPVETVTKDSIVVKYDEDTGIPYDKTVSEECRQCRGVTIIDSIDDDHCFTNGVKTFRGNDAVVGVLVSDIEPNHPYSIQSSFSSYDKETILDELTDHGFSVNQSDIKLHIIFLMG